MESWLKSRPIQFSLRHCDLLTKPFSTCSRLFPTVQVSHHIHCNDEAFDEDVFSSFPLLRFDDRMPQMWWHKYQHMYMVSFHHCFLTQAQQPVESLF